MERKIGEIFKYNGEWYQCVESTHGIVGACEGCSFYTTERLCSQSANDSILGHCGYIHRTDNKNVIFKKLEKVGESFERNGYTYQEYKIHDAKEDIPEFDKVVDECLFGNDKLKLKPFDIQKAREGKPVCTRDGRSVRIICFDAKRKDGKKIIALVLSKDYPGFEDLIAYPNNGNYYGGHENDGDLMMLPEKKEGWVNVYKGSVCISVYPRIYKSREEAVSDNTAVNRIDTVKISWEE